MVGARQGSRGDGAGGGERSAPMACWCRTDLISRSSCLLSEQSDRGRTGRGTEGWEGTAAPDLGDDTCHP